MTDMDPGWMAGTQYRVTTPDKTLIVGVTKVNPQVNKIGQYQIVNNGQTGNQYNAQVTQAPAPIVNGGTRYKKKRFRSKTHRIKPSSNVKRR